MNVAAKILRKNLAYVVIQFGDSAFSTSYVMDVKNNISWLGALVPRQTYI
jgi:hypothetical protein